MQTTLPCPRMMPCGSIRCCSQHCQLSALLIEAHLCQAMTSPVVLEEREDGKRIEKGSGEKIAMCEPCRM